MSVIIFDIYPAKGHLTASFKMANALKKYYEIYYMSFCGRYKKIIESKGFKCYDIKNVMEFNIQGKEMIKYGLFRNKRRNFLNSMFENFISDYEMVINVLKPDLIILDTHHFYKHIIYQFLSHVSIIRFQSMVDTVKRDYVFPICSKMEPVYTNVGYLKADLYWRIFKYFRQIRIFTVKMRYCSLDFNSVVAELRKYLPYSLNKKTIYDRYAPCNLDVDGFPEIIIPPKAFDFDSSTRPFVYYWNVLDVKKSVILSRYNQLFFKFLLNRKQNGYSLIYCSVGTLGFVNNKQMVSFYKKVKKVASSLPNCLFIISCGRDSVSYLFPQPLNVFLFKSVPQQELLAYCDLMITHGGMNSITECISNEVPMLVYPLDKHWDQPGNAARVVYHGMGLKGDMYWATPGSIKRKIEKIWDNYDFYKDNVRKMKARVAAEPDTAMDYINSLLV